MMENVWKKEAVTDVVNVVLGTFLFLTPWFYGYVFEAAASWNAWLSGIAIAGLAIAALAAYAAWESVSPWLVGFHANSVAMHLHVVVGVIVAVVAAARLWFAHHHTRHVTA